LKFRAIKIDPGRFWHLIFLSVGLFFALQILGIVFYEHIVSYRINARISEFREEASYCFNRGNFDLGGFSGSAYLYENKILKRWNNSEFFPPTYFLEDLDSLSYSTASKKYLILFKKSHFHDGNQIDLVSLLPLFQESPRGNSVISDIVNRSIFPLGGIGPDSFEGSSKSLFVGDRELLRFSMHYDRLNLPLSLRIINTLFLFLIVFGIPRSRVWKWFTGLDEKWEALIGFVAIWVFTFLFLTTWFGINSVLMLLAIFISLIFSFSPILFNTSWTGGISLSQIPKWAVSAILILLGIFFTWIFNNWVEVNPSSYLGLNLGFDSASLVRFLVFSSSLASWILFLTFIASQAQAKNQQYLVGSIFLFFSGLLALFDFGNIFIWLLPPGIIFLVKAYYSTLSSRGIFLILSLCFISGSMLISREMALKQRLSQFERIISSINDPNDLKTQNQLKEIQQKIGHDPLISGSFKRTLGSFRSAEKKILNHHFKDLKPGYEIQLLFFDHLDQNLQPFKSTENLTFFKQGLLKKEMTTISPDIVTINNSRGQVQEFSAFIEIQNNKRKLGTVLALGKKRDGFGSGFGPMVSPIEGLSFNSSHWPYSSFKISKLKGLIWEDWVENESIKRELADSIFSHFDMMGSLSFDKAGLYLRGVVFDNTGFGLAFPSPGALTFLGNALLLILSLAFFLLYVFFIKFLTNRLPEFRWNLRAKMQVLYLMAIVFPLGIFSFVLFYSLSNSFEENVQSRDRLKAKNLFDLTKINFQTFLNGIISRGEFIEATRDLSESHGLNISIYDQSGTVFYTDFPSMYKSHVFSPLIDPDLFFDEPGFDLNYKKIRRSNVVFGTVVFPLAASNGRPYYYLFIPFFDNYKKITREQERLGVITMGLFGLFTSSFLLIAFFFARKLLLPLDMLSGQMKGMRLTENPQPIDWKQEDEIGDVVRSYNMMISKLIESREALSLAKQDEAWKEMASQVAHEIKNPLTPMKLRIQQVISSLNVEKNSPELVRYLEDALRNIELIKETANSFHGFASLPKPKNEQIKLDQLLKQVASPFMKNPSADLLFEANGTDFSYFADPKILGGAFLNLILNSLQSVPEGRMSKVKVSISHSPDGNIEVNFEDNGVGVSEELVEKIFEPYFTTKKSGSGLGLQIVKRSIEIYGGEIKISNNSLGGANFTISLPPNDE
jgi:signal transduction histidine kinase